MRRAALIIAGVMLMPAAARAQYYEYAPATPGVEVHLDALDDGAAKKPMLTPPSQPVPQQPVPRQPVPQQPDAGAAPAKRLLKPFFTDAQEEEETAPALPRKKPAPAPKQTEERIKEKEVRATPSSPPPSPPAEEKTPAVPTLSDLSLEFSGTASDVTPELAQKLNAVVAQMKESEDLRLQVRAFAGGEDGNTSSARRISLARALSVRGWLMDHGIQPNRVDVRALGAGSDRSPLDRVDLVFVR
jgi:outer membrane protein OmpA-like peptidoglycan-associated protein